MGKSKIEVGWPGHHPEREPEQNQLPPHRDSQFQEVRRGAIPLFALPENINIALF